MSTLTTKHRPEPGREPGSQPAPEPSRPPTRRSSALSWSQLAAALPVALRKLDPRLMWRTPIMLVVEAGAVLITAIAVAESFTGASPDSGGSPVPAGFTWLIALWLWLTVLFANLAEAVAEGRGFTVSDLSVSEPTLETVFIDLTGRDLRE